MMNLLTIKEEFEDTRGVKSEAVNRRRTDNTMAKCNLTINDLQNTTRKTKDRATQILLKSVGELTCSGSVSLVPGLLVTAVLILLLLK
jgi:hypothetical protein